jgi:hypothetical protein
MRPVSSESPVWALLVVVALAAGCSPDDAETTSTPAGTTSVPVVTTTTLAVTTTSESISTTTSADPTLPGDLLVVGDWGTGTLPQGAVAGAMSLYAEDNEVAAILTTGDNFLSDDAGFLMEPYGWAVDADIPFWVTWGDRDLESEARVEDIEETFGAPPRWSVHEWGAVDVVILDSTQIESEEQSAFLVETLESSEDPTIVVVHHPPYSCGADGDTEGVKERWLGMFDEDVFLVLSGHEPAYQRFEDPTVTYVVTGGGGEQLIEIAECTAGGPGLVAGTSTHHFLVLEQSDGISVSALDVNGQAIDRFTLGLP